MNSNWPFTNGLSSVRTRGHFLFARRWCNPDIQAKSADYAGKPHIEKWVSYVLKSGANWRGPIKDFRLVIEKEKPDNLLSFCGSGVKKISPTRFEMRKTNFNPTADPDILIVEIFDPETN